MPRKATPINPKPILKRKMPMIRVETKPNGYCLTFDGMKNDGYMYFTPAKLLEGFMLHIGLNMTEELDIETMQDFIIAATQWNDNKKCLEEIKDLNNKIRQLNTNRHTIANKAIMERNRLLTLVDGIQRVAHKNKANTELVSQLNTLTKNMVALKPWKLKNFGIGSKDVEPTEEDKEDEA